MKRRLITQDLLFINRYTYPIFIFHPSLSLFRPNPNPMSKYMSGKSECRQLKIKGKTHFEVPVFLLFSIFRPYIFILRYCILVLLFSYRFRPSQPQNHKSGFFSVVDICTALGFPQLHISSSVATLPLSSFIFFLRFLKYKP